MAIYHYGANATPVAPYDTWAKCSPSFLVLAALLAPGDTLYCDSAYSEVITAAFGVSLAGTPAAPIKILCGTRGAGTGLAAMAAGTVIECNNSGGMSFGGAHTYVNGAVFRMSYAASAPLNVGTGTDHSMTMDNCNFEVTGAGGASSIILGTSGASLGSRLLLKNPGLKLGYAGQSVYYSSGVEIVGGSWLAGGVNPTNAFGSNYARGQSLLCVGFDFTNAGTTVNLHGPGQGGAVAIFRDVKVAGAWTGSPIADGSRVPGQTVEVRGLWKAGTYQRIWIKNYEYSLTDEATLVKTGGASDSAGFSWKVVTSANCSAANPARLPVLAPIVTTLAAVSVGADILRDNVTALKDSEVWIEVQSPDRQVVHDGIATPLVAGVAQTAASATWNTTGMTNPNKQILQVSHTPTKVGALLAAVNIAVPSTTLYVDPFAVVV